MKMNLRIGIAFFICLVALPLFIYLVAIKDSITGYLGLCFPVLACILIFGAGLFVSIKTGLWFGLGLFILLLAFSVTGLLFNDLLKIPPPYGGILGVSISFYVAYIVFKKVLPKLLKMQ